ncbi:hypothetical protein [Dyella sp. 20L07]|uniref:hypothetical protein n=1 Tax=Dyella sp. 20L07 TaxID=3384240 RepID=UPI003D2A3C6C
MTTEYRDRKGKLLRVDHGTRVEPSKPPGPKASTHATPLPSEPSPVPAPATEAQPSSGNQEH